MRFKPRIKKIEDQLLNNHNGDRFSNWTNEELETYVRTGIKPVGKKIKIGVSTFNKFARWTDEELEHYVTTGEKPIWIISIGEGWIET